MELCFSCHPSSCRAAVKRPLKRSLVFWGGYRRTTRNKGFFLMGSVSEIGSMTAQKSWEEWQKSLHNGSVAAGLYTLGRSHQCLQGLSRVELNSFTPLRMPSGKKQRVRSWLLSCYLDKSRRRVASTPRFSTICPLGHHGWEGEVRWASSVAKNRTRLQQQRRLGDEEYISVPWR